MRHQPKCGIACGALPSYSTPPLAARAWQRHEFLSNLNWAQLREREGDVPFVPQLEGEEDVSYFIPKVADSPRGVGQSPFVGRQARELDAVAPALGYFRPLHAALRARRWALTGRGV